MTHEVPEARFNMAHWMRGEVECLTLPKAKFGRLSRDLDREGLHLGRNTAAPASRSSEVRASQKDTPMNRLHQLTSSAITFQPCITHWNIYTLIHKPSTMHHSPYPCPSRPAHHPASPPPPSPRSPRPPSHHSCRRHLQTHHGQPQLAP